MISVDYKSIIGLSASALRNIAFERKRQEDEENKLKEKQNNDEELRFRKIFNDEYYTKLSNIVDKHSLSWLTGEVTNGITYTYEDGVTDIRFPIPYVIATALTFGHLKNKMIQTEKNLRDIDSKSIMILADLKEFMERLDTNHLDNEMCFICHTSALPFGFLRKKKYIIKFRGYDFDTGVTIHGDHENGFNFRLSTNLLSRRTKYYLSPLAKY